jgi:uncharacterized protein YkuJ
VENDKEKERVTIRIEETGKDVDANTETAPAQPEEGTKVVFIRDEQQASACYYRGYHDGNKRAFDTINMVLLVIFLALVLPRLLRRATE